jgi:tetratricopeptide (TPR) repeat protein
MSYPGNSSLSEDIRQRVLSTFRQTADLTEEGKREEALLGCEFILRLDPGFDPARALQSRLQAATGAVDTRDLLALLEGEAPAAGEWDLAEELTDLIERRDLRNAMKLIEENAERVSEDDGLKRLARMAQDRLEAQPYVQSFLERAAALRQEGKLEEAEAAMTKARQLDPTHPELAAIAAPGPPALGGHAQGADGGSDDRIERLLAEGQEAFAAKRYQSAIDSWSRIFLIDIDHGEANRRIEEARRLKAEVERQVEELYHEALSLWELGTVAKARQVFERVLERDPHHLAAKEYLERIEQGETPEPTAAEPAEPPSAAAPATEPTAPTAHRPAATPRPPERPAPPAARRRLAQLPRSAFWLIGAVVLLGVLAAAWLLYSRRDGLFPNSEIAESVQPADVLAPARALQTQGETAQAISRLRAVPESHPQRAEARSLIAQWETLLEEPDSAPSEEDLARRIDLIETARVAAGADRHTQAVDLLKEAAAIAPLDPAAADLAAASQEQLEGLGPAIDRFRQGDWEYALPDLWRARETDPGNRTVERLIVDSYYNLAVRDLQRRDVGLAGEKLTEAANLAPEDADLQRLQRFVDQYRGRSLDLRYRIFVKYLPFR